MSEANSSGSYPSAASENGKAAQEIKGFLGQFIDAQKQLSNRIQQTEEQINMLNQKQNVSYRPPLYAEQDQNAPHQDAFGAYLRSGDEEGLRGLELSVKSLGSSVNADGGYLVDPVTSQSIQTVLHSASSLRSVATVVNVEASSYDVLVDHGEVGTGWATETAVDVELDHPQIDRISIPLHELSALPKASQRLLDDSAFDIEAWLAQRIAEKFSRAEAAAFINGDGIDKPKGFLDHNIVAQNSWGWGKLGYTASGAENDVTASAIVDLVYALGSEYRAKASFVMNSKTAGIIRKLKDNDGRFLWSDGLAAAQPATLMGYPVLVAEDMPDAQPNSFPIAFGDFSAGYTIAERPDLRVLRDPFTAKPHVLFYATKRVGGDVSDFAAIKLMKFALS